MSHYDKSKDTMLIDLVSKRPILYSRSHPQHRNYIEKHRAWEEISAILDTPIPGLKQRWKHFRDHYLKKMKQTPKKVEWKYMYLLRFLSEHPKADTPSDKTENKDVKPRSSTVTRNDSSDFANEFEHDGSESASSTGSFSYKQEGHPKWAKIGDLDTLSKETINQTNHKFAETSKEVEKNWEKRIMDKILTSFKTGATPSNPKSNQSGEMSSGTITNPNNEITIKPTSNPNFSVTQSITNKTWIASMKRFGKRQKESSIGSVHQFFEAVADVVSMFPPHLISEAKFAIHKSMYQIERECLGLKDDDEDL